MPVTKSATVNFSVEAERARSAFKFRREENGKETRNALD
ncbi:hypothetical protein RV15_GL001305 [Enterococcus silesiacus]|uniref:Uncharacterized protein n=1 Tax=Enterococcus silesiacus TaxID=332949 RepID=A0AA91GK36_9ENTE|nr:hypothetical protein RV15_GL001305 [Enterococcus silesiacus]